MVLTTVLCRPAITHFFRVKREMAGLTQQDVGAHFEFASGHQSVSNWERGVAPVPPVRLADLCKLYNIQPEELIKMVQTETRDFLMEIMRVGNAG